MSGVVLRCQNCGTTSATAGECQACHEAEVRFFCTNHSPGIWLDNARCSGCGAAFGDLVAPPSGPSPRRELRPPVPPARKPQLTKRISGPWGRPARPAPIERSEKTSSDRDYKPARPPTWSDLLREAASRASRVRREPEYIPPPPLPLGALSGCFIRAVFLMIALLVGLVMLFGSSGGFLLQGF